jgi:hypothetical protein
MINRKTFTYWVRRSIMRRVQNCFPQLGTESLGRETKRISGMTKKVLAFAAVGEAATGVALVILPSLVGWLLLGTELSGVSIPIARVAGFALIALGLACWPGSHAGSTLTRALRAMLCYSLFATLYLGYVGVRGEWVGVLLWPAVALHAVLTLLLARAWLKDQQSKKGVRS